MNNQKHTPGPWFTGSPWSAVLAGGGTFRAVATVHTCNGDWGMIPISEDEARKNRDLIAAAPELLDALITLKDSLPADLVNNPEIVDAALEATRVILKATGGAE